MNCFAAKDNFSKNKRLKLEREKSRRILEMASKNEGVMFWLQNALRDANKAMGDFFPEPVLDTIHAFTDFDVTLWSEIDCSSYLHRAISRRNRYYYAHYYTKGNLRIAGSDLASITFSDLHSRQIKKCHQHMVMDIIRQDLLGPSFYPYSFLNPRPGGKVESLKEALVWLLYFPILIIIGYLINVALNHGWLYSVLMFFLLIRTILWPSYL